MQNGPKQGRTETSAPLLQSCWAHQLVWALHWDEQIVPVFTAFFSTAQAPGGSFIIYQVTNELKQHATLFEHAQSEYFLQNIPPMFITVFQKEHPRDRRKYATLQGTNFSVSADRSA